MKLTLYWSYATRALVRGGQRTLLAIFCVATGVLAIVALQLVGLTVTGALTGNIRAINGGDVAVHTENGDLTVAQLAVFARLKHQGAITAYTPLSVVGVSQGAVRYTLYGVDPAAFPLAGSPHFIAPVDGRLATLLRGRTVVVTSAVLRSLGARVGSQITVRADDGRTVRVVIGGEIANAGLFAQPIMLMDLRSYAAVPSLSGTPVVFTWVYANIPGHGDVRATVVARAIHAQLPYADATTVQDALRQNSAAVQNIRLFLQVTGLLALLLGGIGIVNTMRVLLRRRYLDIALLKTMGYRPRDLYALFGLEVGGVGLAGGIVGAAAGVGVSILVKALVERAFFLTLPAAVDLPTVAAGVAIGVCTSLIFGVLPIVQASRVRPLAVLRQLPAPAGARSRLTAALLVAVVALLAAGILHSLGVALAVVGGLGLLLLALGLVFRGVALLLGALPVPDGSRGWPLLLAGLAALVAVGLTIAAPGIGLLALLAVLLGCGGLLLPRGWRTIARLAVRNIGRQGGQSATTLSALCIGVFAIGLGLALGQSIQGLITHALSGKNVYNAVILARSADKPAVDRQVAHLTGLTRELVTGATPAVLLAVNGLPLGRVPPGGQGLSAGLTGVVGYDVAHGQAPDVTIVRGLQDARTGRTLGSRGAAVLLPVSASQAPLKLKLGDRITLGSPLGLTTLTLRVAGFYTRTGFMQAPLLTDTRAVLDLSGGAPAYYTYALTIDPARVDAAMRRVRAAVPTAQALSLADLSGAIAALLDNIIVVLEAVAGLVMLAGLITIANAVGLAMLERRRDMGILKAIGYTSRGVFGGVVCENGVVGLAGALLAMLLVTLVTAVLGRVAFQAAFGIAPPLAAGLVLATAALCMLVAGAVAWGATRVRPLEVLRYE